MTQVPKDIPVPELTALQIYGRAYRLKNLARLKVKADEYYQGHKEERSGYNAQYYIDNRQVLLDNASAYQAKHADAISLRRSAKITCFCGSEYSTSNKARHERTDKHIRGLEINEIL